MFNVCIRVSTFAYINSQGKPVGIFPRNTQSCRTLPSKFMSEPYTKSRHGIPMLSYMTKSWVSLWIICHAFRYIPLRTFVVVGQRIRVSSLATESAASF